MIPKRFLYNYDVFDAKGSARLAEIDLICTLGSKLGLAEVKADRGFDLNQVDRMIEVAKLVEADFLIFSTMRREDSEEVRVIIEYLHQKRLTIPAFILTREVLFQDTAYDLERHFRVDPYIRAFPHGPIKVK